MVTFSSPFTNIQYHSLSVSLIPLSLSPDGKGRYSQSHDTLTHSLSILSRTYARGFNRNSPLFRRLLRGRYKWDNEIERKPVR